MTRSLPAQMVTDLAADEVTLFYAVELQFDGGTVRLWTGHGDITIGGYWVDDDTWDDTQTWSEGETFTGSGTLLSISGIDEASDLSAKGASITLTGLSSTIISAALQEPYQGRIAKIYIGTDNNGSLSQVETFAGLIDVMTIADDGQVVTVEVTVESTLINLQRPNIRRYTSENHKLRHPGDTFFDFVEKLQDKEIAWGRKIQGGSSRSSSASSMGSEPSGDGGF